MSNVKVKEWVDALEQEFGKGLYRRIKVVRQEDGSKRPIWDMNTMSREQVLDKQHEYTPKSKPPYKASGRGYKESDDWTDYSIFVKHIPNLYCIDYDTHNVEDKSLYKLLMEAGTYYTKTKKGLHFYVMIHDMPIYTNEVDIALTTKDGGEYESAKDIDFIKYQKNIWENKNRSVYGNNFTRIDSDTLKKHLNYYEMNVLGAKDKKTKKLKVSDEAPEVAEQKQSTTASVLDGDILKSYLKRLKPERYSYKYWIDVGFILHQNFAGDDDGFAMWREWTMLDVDVKTRNQGRKLTFMVKKWDSMSTEASNLTWKTLRMWANTDSPQNVYEQAFREGGADGLTKYMNDFCMYNDGTSEYIVELLDKRGSWVLKKGGQMRDKFGRYKFLMKEGDSDRVNPFDVWNTNLNRRDINRIVFDPSGSEQNVFNLWKGYKISKEHADKFDEALAKVILEHIRAIWCNGAEEIFIYVMSWLAWVVQRPHIKIAVLLALKSDEGAGKGVIMEHIKRIMGHHFSETSESGNILGDFNSGLEAKVLIDLDEAFWGGDKKIEGKLKNLITQTEVSINKKCKEPYEIENTTAFMITTNNNHFLPASNGARRFVCCQLNGKYAGVETPETAEYFAAIRNVPSGAFAKVLYNWDISNFRPRRIPRTELLQDQIERQWGSVVKWWFQVLSDGYFTYMGDTAKRLHWGKVDYYRKNGRQIKKTIRTRLMDKPIMEIEMPAVKNEDGSFKLCHKKDEEGNLMYTEKVEEKVIETGYYKDWLYKTYRLADTGYGAKCEPNIFGKELVKIMGQYFAKRRVSCDKIKRVEMIVVPSLKDMRAEFNKIQNWDYKWDVSSECEYMDKDGNVKEGYKITDHDDDY